VMVALTYYGDRAKLAAIGREADLELLNRQAVRLARQVAQEGDALVAGNIANTWVYDPDNHEETAAIVQQIYTEQVRWAAEEGADFIIAETLGYLGEGRIALDVIKQHKLPAVITFGSVGEKLRDGYTHAEACRILAEQGADVVGLNCSRGPATMLPEVAEIRRAVPGYVAALPVPYRTTATQPTFQALREPDRTRGFPIELEPFTHTRSDMAGFAVAARQLGVNYIGICCGGAPHHVRAMAEALGRTVPASKHSPDMALHPMLGAHVREQDRTELSYWKD
jgi:betaine-homocysteine S-methyltransferase